MFFDGGSRGNPGPGACGFVVYDENMRELHREGSFLGVTTNNCAEYRGLISALEYCEQCCRGAVIEVYSDSELVVRQMTGRYKVRSEGLKPLHRKALVLLEDLGALIRHVPREHNKTADAVVNRTLDMGSNVLSQDKTKGTTDC